MKQGEVKPEIIFRIIDKHTGEAKGAYSRACFDEFDFKSVEQARTANVCGMFNDKQKYRIAKYKVTYELLEESVD
jgi:hypothetical protein